MRWHKLLAGRIVASVDAPTGDEAERALAPSGGEMVVSDADWRAMHHRRRLRPFGGRIVPSLDILPPSL